MRAKGPSASRRRSPKRQGVWGLLKVPSGVQGQSPGGGAGGEAPRKILRFHDFKAHFDQFEGHQLCYFRATETSENYSTKEKLQIK